MTTRTTPIRAKRLAQSIAGLNVLMLLAGLILGIGFSGTLFDDDLSGAFFRVVPSVMYSVLAVLVLSRQRGHTVGWLFLIVGFFLALASLPSQAMESYTSSELVRGLITWVGHLVWIPAFIIPISLVLLFFPDGRLPSRRWRPIAVAAIMGMCGYAASLAFYPWPWEAQGILDANNPFGIAGSEGFFDVFVDLSITIQGVGIIGSLVAVVVRFRRSQGVERIQMKWLVYTAGVAISAMLLMILLFRGFNNPATDYIFISLPTLMSFAIGISILRFRLFDIDILIRRTLQYAILTAILAMIYFGGVVLLQAGMGALTGRENSPIIIVLATLGIAALFNPLRLRVQDFIDRRFFRAKYDAEKTLAAFAAIARDEVDTGLLAEALLEVVDETMQPNQVSLWFR